MCQEINVPVTIPRSLYMFIHKLLDKSIIIKHTLQMKKFRHRKKQNPCKIIQLVSGRGMI